MTSATDRLMTLEAYLTYDDGTETRYELVNGELVEVPLESDLNNLISLFLLVQFLRFVPVQRLRHKDTEIAVTGARATVRIPDLIVLTEEGAAALSGAKRSIITADMPPPALVVEVVSPGSSNQERDYRYKRSEYAARGIAEYWIIDPQQAQVTILTLVAGFYEVAVYRERDRLISPLFPNLELTATQVLQAGTNE
ncbi:Uma2 family endonuclease [Kovacikia minuta CCNUW1]|uniref:Uma2 family endonuclease n=1 Tax=Kovacikia minuta TaxID=2931930 RepID=UPI001CC9C610|nr:Uma2 family endonuclease [Kovacikia minuta]UBF23830.1 Uma2 family endonuclease [Kovacikia minuta CCNUW1]